MMNNFKTSVKTKALLIMAVVALSLPALEISAQPKKPVNKPAANKTVAKKPVAKNNAGSNTKSVSNSGNRNNNVSTGNKINVDNSKKNVNVNIDNSKDIRVNNSRNTVVRHNSRPYGRPPYAYGGYRYRCYNPYFFHPYRPFIWGPRWHPWGFFITTLAVTAILISVDNIEPPVYLDLAMAPAPGYGDAAFENQQRMHGPWLAAWQDNPVYHFEQNHTYETIADGDIYYDEGVYYLKADGGYTVISAPLGVNIKSLPSGYETITLDNNTKNYYYGGTFYEKNSAGYTVVAPIAGSVISNVSEGGEEVKLGEVTYVKLGETYYQPIQLNGKNMYEVVDVEEDK